MGASSSKTTPSPNATADLLASSKKSNSGNGNGNSSQQASVAKNSNSNGNASRASKPPQGNAKKENAGVGNAKNAATKQDDPFCRIDPETIQKIAEELNRSIVVRAPPNAQKNAPAPQRVANGSNGNGNGRINARNASGINASRGNYPAGNTAAGNYPELNRPAALGGGTKLKKKAIPRKNKKSKSAARRR